MPIQAGDAVWRILGDLGPLKEQLGQAGDLVKSTMDGFVAHAQTIGIAFTAIGGTVTAALGGMVSQAISYGDEIDKAGIKTGIATDELQKLKFGAEQSGVGFEQLQDAIIKMNRSVSEARDSSKDFTEKGLAAQGKETEKLTEQQAKLATSYDQQAAKLQQMMAGGKATNEQIVAQQNKVNELRIKYDQLGQKLSDVSAAQLDMSDATGSQLEAFQKLGISLDSLNGMSPDQQFMKIADAISRVPDPAMRTAVAMDLFGKSGAQLIPFFNEGAAGMTALGQKAQELGLIMSGEAIDNSVILGDQIDALKSQATALAVQIGSALVPAIIEMMPAIQATVASVIQWIQNNPQLVTTIVEVVGVIGATMAVLGPLLIMLPGIVTAFAAIGPVVAAVGAVLVALTGPVGIVIAAIGALVAAGVYVYKHWEEFVEGAEILWEGFTAAISAIWEGIKDAFEVGLYIVTTPLRQFVDGVQAGWEILQIAAGFLVDTFNAAWDAIVGGFEWVGDQLAGLWDWIAGLMQSGVDGIVAAVNYLSNLFGLGNVFGNPDAQAIPGKAVGGPVEAGMPYIVGEQGQELFVPESDGRIVPAGRTAQMMGGGPITINVNGYNRDPRSLAEEISRTLHQQQIAWGMS